LILDVRRCLEPADRTHSAPHRSEARLESLDARGEAVCVVQRPRGETGDRPLFDFRPGYIERALSDLPRQGSGSPWVMSASYALDERLLTREPVIDSAMRLKAAPSTARSGEPVA
jgi:hypothetical protein